MLSSGTCIVALTDGRTLAIAADSLAVDATDHPTTPSELVCKIFTANGFVCTGAGLMQDTNTGFSVKDCFLDACSRFNDLDSIGAQLGAYAKHGMETFIFECKTELPWFYERLKQDSTPLIQIFLAGVDRGVPRLRLMAIRLTMTDNVEVTSIPTAEFAYIDHGHTLTKLMVTRPHLLQESGSVTEAARRLVQAACDGNPVIVGGPVDVIAIDVNGPRWIHRKPDC